MEKTERSFTMRLTASDDYILNQLALIHGVRKADVVRIVLRQAHRVLRGATDDQQRHTEPEGARATLSALI